MMAPTSDPTGAAPTPPTSSPGPSGTSPAPSTAGPASPAPGPATPPANPASPAAASPPSNPASPTANQATSAASPTAPSPRTLNGSRLGDLLVRRSLITAEQLATATNHHKDHGGNFAATLVRLGILTEEDLTACLRKEYRLPLIDPMAVDPPADVLKMIPHNLARKHMVLPISLAGSVLTVALADPSNMAAIDECRFLTGCNIRITLAPARVIQKAIERHYSILAKVYSDAVEELDAAPTTANGAEQAIDLQELQKAIEEAPLVKLVNALLADAVERRASDIHVEPFEDDLRIRFRVDGMLYDVMRPPPRYRGALASRIKIMAALDISERRMPQDGSLKVVLGRGKEASFRVSSLPTVNGEKLVLRLMDKSGLRLDMTQLGFEPSDLAAVQEVIERPYGMVLVTGPTGSGKTTTLYSVLSEVNKSARNISTAEDPVELNLWGINQVQVNPEIGMTFSHALRAFLRQDPDVIMVGEIRDGDTADIAVKAALTGHLVLSTLHTNDAPTAVTRLLDMGVEPFLVSSSIALVVAQRLVRMICPYCRQETAAPASDILTQIGFTEDDRKGLQFFRGKGCDECAETGYRGRLALYEVLQVTDGLQDLIVGRAHAREIRQKAVEAGMRTLRASGREKVRRGQTTFDEVLRVTI